MRRKGDAVTIHEVARAAGVSPMTVSRVMNGNSNVREATRELVLRAVKELNYSPNPAARSLAAAQGTRIGLVYTNPSAAYLSELLVGETACHHLGCAPAHLPLPSFELLDGSSCRTPAPTTGPAARPRASRR